MIIYTQCGMVRSKSVKNFMNVNTDGSGKVALARSYALDASDIAATMTVWRFLV
jgi:hypothetical protein